MSNLHIGIEDLAMKIQAPQLMAEGFPNRQLVKVLGKVEFLLEAGFPNRIIKGKIDDTVCFKTAESIAETSCFSMSFSSLNTQCFFHL
jgi:hypothetical protein